METTGYLFSSISNVARRRDKELTTAIQRYYVLLPLPGRTVCRQGVTKSKCLSKYAYSCTITFVMLVCISSTKTTVSDWQKQRLQRKLMPVSSVCGKNTP